MRRAANKFILNQELVYCCSYTMYRQFCSPHNNVRVYLKIDTRTLQFSDNMLLIHRDTVHVCIVIQWSVTISVFYLKSFWVIVQVVLHTHRFLPVAR